MTTPYPGPSGAPTHISNNNSHHRSAGREHIPIYPRGFIALRFVQLLLAILVIGLCGFGVHLLATNGACLSLFVGSATIITMVWLIVAHYSMPKIYNYWAVLALDIFLLIFWLVGFAVLASEVSILFANVGYYDGYSYRSASPEGLLLAYLSCLAAAAGIGGVLFALFVTSLALHSLALHRHRAAGLHCNPASASASATGSQGRAAPNNASPEKTSAFATAQPAYHGTQIQQPQQYYDPGQDANHQPPQGYYNPQGQYPQAQYPPQQTASPPPLSVQLTGGSGTQVSSQHGNVLTSPVSAHEVPAQSYHQPHQ